MGAEGAVEYDRFTWLVPGKDPGRKHGVAFDEAMTAFSDPLSILLPDPDHSVGEKRYLVLGMSNRRRLLVVAFAERPPRTRLIPARRATRGERRKYEEKG